MLVILCLLRNRYLTNATCLHVGTLPTLTRKLQHDSPFNSDKGRASEEETVRKLFLPHCNIHLCCHSPFFSLSTNTSQPCSKVTLLSGAIMVDYFREGAIRWHCGTRPELFQQVFPYSCVCGRRLERTRVRGVAYCFLLPFSSSLICSSNMRSASNMRRGLDTPSEMSHTNIRTHVLSTTRSSARILKP